jgi:hypothetical protein
MEVSFLRAGSMEDDDCDLDSSRAGAREVVKSNKKGKYENASVVPANENVPARSSIVVEMEAHTKMSNIRLILQVGTAKEKARVLKDIVMDLNVKNNAKIVTDGE